MSANTHLIFRKDADVNEIKFLLNENPNDQFIHIWREFESDIQPYKWRVWPHSVSKEWMDSIEQEIKYE